jgi:probable HAF family extracellular repeat protein
MRYHRLTAVLVGGALASTVLAGPAMAAPARPHQYRAIELGKFAFFSQALAVNDHDVVIGTSGRSDHAQVPFLWRNGRMTELPGLQPHPSGDGKQGSFALAINNRDQVVGASQVDGVLRSVVWANGTVRDLGVGEGSANSINDRGQIVGEWFHDSQPHVFRWDNGVVTDLGVGLAQGINNDGDIVGATFVGGALHATRWHHGTKTDLGALGNESGAREINNQGDVLGSSSVPVGESHAVLWRDRRLFDLSVPGADGSTAHGINDRGQVIFGTGGAGTFDHPYLWQNGRTTDLNPALPDTEHMVTDINNPGHLVGAHRGSDGSSVAVLYV